MPPKARRAHAPLAAAMARINRLAGYWVPTMTDDQRALHDELFGAIEEAYPEVVAPVELAPTVEEASSSRSMESTF